MIYLAFDTETSFAYNMGYDMRAYPVCLCIHTSTGEMKSWVFNHSEMIPEPFEEMRQDIQGYIDNAELIIAHNCFSGDTEYITNSGKKSFKDTVGTRQVIWNREGWNQGKVKHYGKDKLTTLTLVPYNRSRTSIKKEIKTTANHRWLANRIKITNKFGRQRVKLDGYVNTSDLRIGDTIHAEVPQIDIDKNSDGFRHGLIFGDGSKVTNRKAYQIRLCGKKEQYKDSFSNYSYPPSAEGDPVVNYYKSDIDLKSIPKEADPTYTANFIEGWIATDGTRRKDSYVVSTVNEEAAKWLEANASVGGWFCTGVSKHNYPYGFISDKDFWMIVLTKDEQMGWTVASIDNSDDTLHDVYCIEVPQGGEFTLSGGIYTANCKFDLHWLRRLGIDYSKCKLWCTQVVEYLINGENNRVRYSLQETSDRYKIPPKHDIVKEWWDAGYETCDIPLHIVEPYCQQDTANTLAIYQQQRIIVEKMGLTKLAALSCEMSRILADIEWNGMKIDVPLCTQYSKEYGEKIEQLYTNLSYFVVDNILDLHELPLEDNQGKRLPNFGSGEQLSCILFGGDFQYKGRIEGARQGTTKNGTVTIKTKGLGLIPREGTELAKQGYYQVDKAQLSSLKVKNKTQRTFIEQLTELFKLEKMKGTYLDSFIDKNIDSMIHCNIHQTRTVTGRFSATNPALQTIPRSSTSSDIKSVFISRYED